MSGDESEALRERQLQMQGHLLAGFSHQLNNHLAVIRESNGLLMDLLHLEKFENPALLSRLRQLAETVDVRVEQVAEMAGHLSGFAHRNDTPLSSFYLHDLLEEELAFLSRFARLKSIEIAENFDQDLPKLFNDPALVQFIFSSVFLFLLPFLDAGSTLTAITRQQNGAIAVGLCPTIKESGRIPPLDNLGDDPALQAALKRVGSTLSIQSANDSLTIIFAISNSKPDCLSSNTP